MICAAGGDHEDFELCREYPDIVTDVTCGVDRATAITVYIIVAIAILYFGLTCILLLARLRGYRNMPYTFAQVGLVYNTLQVDTVASMTFMTVTAYSICLMLGYTCWSYLFQCLHDCWCGQENVSST